MKTSELIVQLARDAGPVRPLASPSVRLVRWIAAAFSVTALGVIALHPRPDVAIALHNSAYLARWVTTLATAVLGAAVALVLSVPGAERSPYIRALPFLALGLWSLVLAVLLTNGGDSLARLIAFPINPLCIYEIAGLGAVPAVALFAMSRRGAPLHPGWSAIVASLAGIAAGAAGTQLLCPVDNPAHQLVGHVLPVLAFTLIAGAAGRPFLNWTRQSAQQPE